MSIEERLEDLRTESQIQREIILELRQRGAIVFRMNAGRGKQNQRLAPPGTPDLFVVEPGHDYWIEVKGPTGRLSQEQKDMHEALERMGQEVIVARGVEDV